MVAHASLLPQLLHGDAATTAAAYTAEVLHGYMLQFCNVLAAAGAMVVSINLGRDVEELNVNGLIPGTKYNFIVIAKSNAAYSPEATVQVTTLGKAPAPPPAPAAAPAPQQQQQQQPAASTPVPAAAAPAQPALVPAFAPAAAPAVTTDSSEQVEFKQPAAAQPATITTDCRSDVEPAPPQSFTAVPLGKDKMSLSWQNGDPGICTQAYKIDAYQLKTGDRVIGTETGEACGRGTSGTPCLPLALSACA